MKINNFNKLERIYNDHYKLEKVTKDGKLVWMANSPPCLTMDAKIRIQCLIKAIFLSIKRIRLQFIASYKYVFKFERIDQPVNGLIKNALTMITYGKTAVNDSQEIIKLVETKLLVGSYLKAVFSPTIGLKRVIFIHKTKNALTFGLKSGFSLLDKCERCFSWMNSFCD